MVRNYTSDSEDELARIRNMVRRFAPGTFPVEPRYNEDGTMTTMSRQIIETRRDMRQLQRREAVLREYSNRLEGINSGNLANFMSGLAGPPNSARPPNNQRSPGDTQAFNNAMRCVFRAVIEPPRNLASLPDLPRELHHQPGVAPRGGGARGRSSSIVASETTTTTVAVPVSVTSSTTVVGPAPVTSPAAATSTATITGPTPVTIAVSITSQAATAASTSGTNPDISSSDDDSSDRD